MISAIKASGFSIGKVDATRIIEAPEKKGVIIGFRIYSDDEKNPKVSWSEFQVVGLGCYFDHDRIIL